MAEQRFLKTKADVLEEIPSSYVYFNLSLSKIDADDWITRLSIMGGAIVFHGVIFISFSAILHLALTKDHEVPFRNKMLASFQVSRCAYALVAIAGALYTLLVPNKMSTDIVAGRSAIGVFIVAFTTGFHITDTITVLVGHYALDLKNSLLTFHHVLMLILYSGILLTDTGYYIGCVFLLAEIPIPFLTVKLLLLGLRTSFPHTALGKVNDFLVVHCFHLRNAFDIFLCSQLYFNGQVMYDKMPLVMVAVVVSFMIIMSTFLVPYYIYFFSQMCLGHHLAENSHANHKLMKKE